MTEEDISSSGQFTALSTAEVATPYQPSGSAAPAGIASTPAVPRAAASAASIIEAKSTKQPTAQDINNAIAAANANLASAGRLLDYRVDSITGLYIAQIRNSQTGEVLEQIPGADLLAIARLLADWTPGKHMLFDVEA